jgi:uncharacterized protein YwqG
MRSHRVSREQGITRLLKKYKLERHRAEIESGLLPAVHIWCSYRPSPPVVPGGSKLGGEPDLHWSETWPSQEGRPLHFLGQLRLSEIARHLPRGSLPRKGRLTLWYNSIAEQERGERTRIRGEFEPSLLHLGFDPDEARPVQRRPWPIHREEFRRGPLEHWSPYPETPVRFERIRTLRRSAMASIVRAEEGANEGDGWNRCYEFSREVERAGNRYDGRHQILGDVHEIQGDARYSAACCAAGVSEYGRPSVRLARRLRAEAARYQLLVKLDTDPRGPGFQWGDDGSLQWWIRRDHLAAGRLDLAVGVYDQGS